MQKPGFRFRNKQRVILAVALLLCFLSAVGASLIQTSGGSVTVKDLRWETPSGHLQSALLFIPDGVTAENPAPAIVCSHGWYNTREMQDLNYVEYARRGYVVLSINMYGHGDSDDLTNGTWWNPENGANGMYDAVKLMASLPYVDASRIGVTGHSNGARASREAVLLDNQAETPLIAAVLLVSNDAVYTDENKQYINMFGDRDAGIVACQYDEFFHRVVQADGSKSSPREYINQVTAQSFLNFGKDPAGLETRSGYTLYTENVDGKDAVRVIYNPNQIHPWAHFSGSVVSSSLEFFDAALGTPSPIASGNQIWQWKAVFNLVGLVGFFIFLVSFVLVMLETRTFAVLKAEGPVLQAETTGKGRAWLWGGLAAGAVFSMLCYQLIYTWSTTARPAFFNQTPPFYIGMWSLLCGLFTLLVLFLSYRLYGKANGLSLREQGVVLAKGKVGKTILLGLLSAVAAYSLVFLADYFFKTDFRLWCFTLRAFDADKLGIVLKYLPFFLVFYVVNSVAINGFNFVCIGKKEWVNTVVMAAFNALSPAIMIVWMYAHFFNTGFTTTDSYGVGGSIIGIWLFPIVVILPLAAIISRIIYKKTRNPYISGIAMAIIATTMACTNTLTLL